jgi:hypothetical protein
MEALMKYAGSAIVLLTLCFGCSAFPPEITERFGPGQDSEEFSDALHAVVEPGTEAISVLASWYPETYGYENMGVPALDHPAGVLVVTETDVIFFGWNDMEYAPKKTIPRLDLTVVVTEALGKSRRLVLGSENDLNTFELVREDRMYVDSEGTEVIAALLSNDPDVQ